MCTDKDRKREKKNYRVILHYVKEFLSNVKAYSPYIDYGTASLTAMGTLAAIIERNQTGKGQIVEGALFATSLAFMNTQLKGLKHANRETITWFRSHKLN